MSEQDKLEILAAIFLKIKCSKTIFETPTIHLEELREEAVREALLALNEIRECLK